MQPLSISLLQTHLFWEDPQQNILQIEEQLKTLPPHTHLTILPEMFTTGFSMNPKAHAETMDGETVQWMKKKAAEKKTILVGSVMIKEGEKYFNRLLWVLPNGQVGQYDKRHLFAYAGEDQHYTPGQKRLITSVNGWRINLQVCYDLRFPVWSRQRSAYDEEGNFQPEYDILIYVANWPARRAEAWKTLLRARAIENQSYVIGVNRIGADGNGNEHAGDSQVIDPGGNILHSCESRAERYSTTLNPQLVKDTRDRFPFLRDADGFMILSDDFSE
ncbi:MAG: amidohydrolase [Bacteroidetes bacterium]|nr:amidohydrolase [Bacteroidota bacterium]